VETTTQSKGGHLEGDEWKVDTFSKTCILRSPSRDKTLAPMRRCHRKVRCRVTALTTDRPIEDTMFRTPLSSYDRQKISSKLFLNISVLFVLTKFVFRVTLFTNKLFLKALPLNFSLFGENGKHDRLEIWS